MWPKHGWPEVNIFIFIILQAIIENIKVQKRGEETKGSILQKYVFIITLHTIHARYKVTTDKYSILFYTLDIH